MPHKNLHDEMRTEAKSWIIDPLRCINARRLTTTINKMLKTTYNRKSPTERGKTPHILFAHFIYQYSYTSM